ncbi:MAG TPA: Smr/MutS family protein, partial [Kofleriaceae bacterium]
EDERAALLAELETAEADRAAWRARRDKAAAQLDKQLARAHSDSLGALKAARRDIEDLRRVLRAKAQPTLDDVREATRLLTVPAAEVARHEPKRAQLPGTPATLEQLVPGAPVIVPRLGRAEVTAVPTGDGRVDIRLGAMRASVPIGDVLLDTHRRAQRDARAESPDRTDKDELGSPPLVLVDGVPAGGGKSGARTIETTIDVRGHRVDDAITQVDRFVDESLLAGRDSIFIVHGHGTGALRSAIRTHLATHAGLAAVRAGEQGEGGDGVTVAFLKG